MLRCSMKRADRLDYKIYHNIGDKIVMDEKVDETGAHALAGNNPDNLDKREGENPSLENLVLMERKSFAYLRNDFSLYDPDDLVTHEEFNEAIDIIKDGGQKYRHIHVELQNLLGVEYDEKYPKYEDNLDKIMGFIKSLRKKLREAKKCSNSDKIA